MSDSTPEQRAIECMRHAVAWPARSRNYFAADPGSPDDQALAHAVGLGWAQLGKPPDTFNGLRFYHVTELGLSQLEIDRGTTTTTGAVEVA